MLIELHGYDVPFTVRDGGGQRRVTIAVRAANMEAATLVASAQMRVLGYLPGEFEPFLEAAEPEETLEQRCADYEKRWLAECRAHGQAQRALRDAQALLERAAGYVTPTLKDDIRTFIKVSRG